MILSHTGETGMKDQIIFFRRRIITGGIMTRGSIPIVFIIRLEEEIPDHLYPVRFYIRILTLKIFPPRAVGVYHILPLSIKIRSVRILGPRYSDVVPASGVQPAKTEEKIIITGRLIVQNIRSFDTAVIAAGQLFPVTLVRKRKARFRVKFQNENTAGIRTVNHPQLSFGIIKNMGIHHVGMHVGVIYGLIRRPHTAGL